eukprot:3814630-Pleurochrysis_carterae.AAC.1
MSEAGATQTAQDPSTAPSNRHQHQQETFCKDRNMRKEQDKKSECKARFSSRAQRASRTCERSNMLETMSDTLFTCTRPVTAPP